MGCITTLLVESVALGKKHCKRTTDAPPKHSFDVANVFWISSLAFLLAIVSDKKYEKGFEEQIRAVSCVGNGREMYQVPDEILTRLTELNVVDLSKIAQTWKDAESLFWDIPGEDLTSALKTLQEAATLSKRLRQPVLVLVTV